jgi:hypothetical protein
VKKQRQPSTAVAEEMVLTGMQLIYDDKHTKVQYDLVFSLNRQQ